MSIINGISGRLTKLATGSVSWGRMMYMAQTEMDKVVQSLMNIPEFLGSNGSFLDEGEPGCHPGSY